MAKKKQNPDSDYGVLPPSGPIEPATHEEHDIEMHQQMALDIIQRQAGTLGKAILEGVMNSVDARAKHCAITLNQNVLRIVDDGCGFTSRQEILTKFKKLGQPHEAGEHKIFGRFRMGRGQLFAYGVNDWFTNGFTMNLDIKERGLKFKFAELTKPQPGCTVVVTLYEPLSNVGLRETEHEVRQLVRWMGMHDIEITFNGEGIADDPRQAKWTAETDNCWIRVASQKSAMEFYNIGAHVMTKGAYVFGVGGEVVSKVQLKVNYARNDIMSDCPVWKDIKKCVDKEAGKEIKKRPVLTDASRQRLADQLLDGTLADVSDAKIFTDVLGRHWALKQLRATMYDMPMSVAAEGDQRGDRLHQMKLAFVFSKETLTRFRLRTAPDLLKLLRQHSEDYDFRETKCVPYEDLVKKIDKDFHLIEEKDWTPAEQLAVQLCNRGYNRLQRALDENELGSPRRVIIGLGPANGWTDGESYVALDRKWCEVRDFTTIKGITDLGRLLLHELCHDAPDTETHGHTMEFYQQFHDAHEGLTDFIDASVGLAPTLVERLGKKLTKRQLVEQDRAARLAKTKVPVVPAPAPPAAPLSAAADSSAPEESRRLTKVAATLPPSAKDDDD